MHRILCILMFGFCLVGYGSYSYADDDKKCTEDLEGKVYAVYVNVYGGWNVKVTQSSQPDKKKEEIETLWFSVKNNSTDLKSPTSSSRKEDPTTSGVSNMITTLLDAQRSNLTVLLKCNTDGKYDKIEASY